MNENESAPCTKMSQDKAALLLEKANLLFQMGKLVQGKDQPNDKQKQSDFDVYDIAALLQCLGFKYKSFEFWNGTIFEDLEVKIYCKNSKKEAIMYLPTTTCTCASIRPVNDWKDYILSNISALELIKSVNERRLVEPLPAAKNNAINEMLRLQIDMLTPHKKPEFEIKLPEIKIEACENSEPNSGPISEPNSETSSIRVPTPESRVEVGTPPGSTSSPFKQPSAMITSMMATDDKLTEMIKKINQLSGDAYKLCNKNNTYTKSKRRLSDIKASSPRPNSPRLGSFIDIGTSGNKSRGMIRTTPTLRVTPAKKVLAKSTEKTKLNNLMPPTVPAMMKRQSIGAIPRATKLSPKSSSLIPTASKLKPPSQAKVGGSANSPCGVSRLKTPTTAARRTSSASKTPK